MLRFRPLPIMLEIERLISEGDEKSAVARRNGVAIELFRGEGIQFVAKILRDVQLEALSALNSTNEPQFHVGRLNAIVDIRKRLLAISPDEVGTEVIQDDELEEPFLYESGFDIPHPSGT